MHQTNNYTVAIIAFVVSLILFAICILQAYNLGYVDGGVDTYRQYLNTHIHERDSNAAEQPQPKLAHLQ